MNSGLYRRLAFDGIRKNKRLYIPYTLSIVVMVAISFILSYITNSPVMESMGGGSTMKVFMGLGQFVMVIFSVLFLFYTNSFLAKRRNSEYALYNVLGMNKANVIRIMGRESLYIGAIGILGGFTVGMLGSKLFELLLLKLCGYDPDNTFYFSWNAIRFNGLFYAAVLLVLFIFSAGRIAKTKTIDLLKSKSTGEKVPKANAVTAILGLIILTAAYVMAVTMKNPTEAFTMFFLAVVMVIVATYMLFISGSVWLCKILKKNKKYYYNPKHFVSVSGMMYRMKRNGAGLASICILCTMVLVMISASGSLYFGKEHSLKQIYTYEFSQVVSSMDYTPTDKERANEIKAEIKKIYPALETRDYYESRSVSTMAYKENDGFSLNKGFIFDVNSVMLIIIPFEDYSAKNKPEALSDNEVLVSVNGKTVPDSFVLNGREYSIAGFCSSEGIPNSLSTIMPTYYVVVNDYDGICKWISDYGAYSEFDYTLGFDTPDLSEDEQLALYSKFNENGVPVTARIIERREFVEMYGSLLLLGIFLSIAFVGACVLIIYFKQITEGYEDVRSYSIMRKVGMTKKEIKSGINTQTLIAFFSPLAMTGLHLGFSFMFVYRMLAIFGIVDMGFLIFIYICCFIVFSLFYYFVYRRTVKAYYEIVTY